MTSLQHQHHLQWNVVHLSQEESGPKRKLSCHWHGPYRVISKNDPDVEVVKVFFSQEDKIQVHRSKIKKCSPYLIQEQETRSRIFP